MITKKLFTSDYKKEIVKFVTELNKKPKEAVEDIGITPTTIRSVGKRKSLKDYFPIIIHHRSCMTIFANINTNKKHKGTSKKVF